jgi:hypothetical protein
MATTDELFILATALRAVQPRMLKKSMAVLLLAACGGTSEQPSSADPPSSEPSAPEQQSDPEPEPERPEPATAPMTVTRCVPGQVISCRRGGTQTCLRDGSRYGECLEPEPAPSSEPEPDTEPEPMPEPEPECTCVELEEQTVTCSRPNVACNASGRDAAFCRSQGSTEQIYWNGEARRLELSYPAVLSNDTYQASPDSCSLEAAFDFADPYFIDPYELPNGCVCTVSAISCSGAKTLSRACN